ncbi:Permease of the drug/metabolite transporter (DMT) superfamily [Duganella sp. CF517]|uniref:DMT family transporter n=1 Tax=Duganella sp. CF517 TaxID=1881038 RepID=UPI0008C24971|nr:DMT family transporter [Duganella sp. CF517]SEO07390.1 Permease of the drug/metabolite transporter (DMT) superfamily [Duganella sp. CF517]
MWQGVLCGLLAGAMWGMVFIVPAFLTSFTALEMACGRYIAYGVIAAGLMLPRLPALLRRLDRGDVAAMIKHALAGNIVYYTLLALGVRLAGVSATSLIIGVLPISVTLMGQKDHGSVPLKQLMLPLLLVAAGIACINVDVFTHDPGHGAPLADKLLGVMCAVGALLCWTWYSVDNARYLKRNPHFSSGEWSALYGVSSGLIALAVALPALALYHADVTGAGAAASGRDWTLFWIVNGLLALGASVIGNHLWNVASRKVPLTLSGQLILFETLFALLYGFIYKQQLPRGLEVAAMVLLAVGVMWSVRIHALDDTSGAHAG